MAQQEQSHRLYKPNLVITTPRLILRDVDLSEECCAGVHRIRSDPRVTKMIGNKPPAISGMKDWLRDKYLAKPNTFKFWIELRHPSDPSAIGTAANMIGTAGATRMPEFGYTFDPEQWGKGYATEAMRAILDAYWDTWPNGMPSLPKENRDVVWLKISPSNEGSMKIAQKLGFVAIGEEYISVPPEAEPNTLVTKFSLPRPEGGPDRPRAYEKIESVGPNLSEGPAVDE